MTLYYGILRGRVDVFKREDNDDSPHLQIRVVDDHDQAWRAAVNVLSGDRGRPLAHITHKLRYPDLLQDAQTVLQTLVPIEQEISSEDGRWYAIRLLPYRTVDDRIDGVVITLVDITQHRVAGGKS